MRDGTALCKRYEFLKGKRSTWEPVWTELQEFIRPNKRRVNQTQSPGSKQTQRLFDTTAPDQNRKLGGFIQGALTSASTRFFGLITRDVDMMKDREVAIWLDDTSTRIYAAFQQSNFMAKTAQLYGSLTAMGTAAVILEERDLKVPGFNGFRFTGIPVGEFVMDEDADGVVNTFVRQLSMSAIAAVMKFGEKSCPKYLVEMSKQKPHERVEFLHYITPRYVVQGLTKGSFPIASYYIETKEKTIVSEGGYHEMPVMAPRWETEEGEIYGKGPGYLALPDIRSLNKLRELGLQAATLAVRPPLQVPHDGVLGGIVRLTPGGQTTVMGDRDIKPIVLGGDVNQEVIRVEDLTKRIQSVFYRDLVALPDKNYMTATEIIKQLDLIHRELGPTMGQLQNDWLDPLIDRAFNMMFRAGAFLPPPPALAGADLDVEYEGPLARAQRTGDFTALQEAYTMVAAMSEHDPEAMDLLDTDEIVNYTWEVSGAPARLLREKNKVAQIRKARADQAAATAQIQTLQGAADVAHTTAQTMQTMQPAGAA